MISIVFVYKNAVMERKQNCITRGVRRMRRRASGQSTSAQLCTHTEDKAKSKRRFCVRITSIIFRNQFSRSECSGGGGGGGCNSRPSLHLCAVRGERRRSSIKLMFVCITIGVAVREIGAASARACTSECHKAARGTTDMQTAGDGLSV